MTLMVLRLQNKLRVVFFEAAQSSANAKEELENGSGHARKLGPFPTAFRMNQDQTRVHHFFDSPENPNLVPRPSGNDAIRLWTL